MTELKIEVDLVAGMTVYNPFDFFVEESAETWPFQYPEDIRPDLSIYNAARAGRAQLQKFLAGHDRSPRNTSTSVTELNARTPQSISYIVRLEGPACGRPRRRCPTPGAPAAPEAGCSSRPCATRPGRPLRVGLLIQLKPDLVALDGTPGTDHDITDLPAWAEVLSARRRLDRPRPHLGPADGREPHPSRRHPALPQCGAHFRLASYAEVDFSFDMKVTRVAEHPRITKPFSDESWERLDALGHQVDASLAQNDVRLTMGGEPTFVSIDDFEADEWNAGAVGPTKRGLADGLIRRLRDRFAPNGLIHHGQGKWYPGETLPRWTFSLYWRLDGKPVWRDETLIAREGATMASPLTMPRL